MTADRSVMERRLMAAFADSPSVAGAAMLDGRISAAIAAGSRPHGAGAGPMGRRRTPWMLPAAAVVALAVAGGGGLAWLSGRSAVPGPGSTAPVGAVLPSPSGEPSSQPSSLPNASPSLTPERIVITPPPTSAEPLPVMDARAVVEALERRPARMWWSPGRLLDPVVPVDGQTHGVVRFRADPARGVAIEITPLEGALVQIGSTASKGDGADPLGCAVGSVGRYQVAASDERLDLRVVDDACQARVETVEGTWQAGLRSDRPTLLVPWDGRQLNDAIRFDARTTGFAGTGPSLLPDGREGEPVSTIPVRAFGFHHPDGAVFLGRPVRDEIGACLLGPDRLQDVPLQTAEEALADLEARPGVRVVGTQQIEGDGVRLLRVDVAVVDEPDACGRRTLFASPPLSDDSIPLWQIPKPQPGEASAPVYLATVSGPDGESMAIALVERRLEPDADLDAIATQVFGMIDWQPELHPPAWPAE